MSRYVRSELNSNHGCVVAAMLNEVGNFPCVPRSGKSPSTFGGLRGALLVKKVAFLNEWPGSDDLANWQKVGCFSRSTNGGCWAGRRP